LVAIKDDFKSVLHSFKTLFMIIVLIHVRHHEM